MSNTVLDKGTVDEAFRSNTTRAPRPKQSEPKIFKFATWIFVGIILVLAVVMFLIVFDGRKASGGKDSLVIANAYVDALVSGNTDDFYTYIPNEALNRDAVLESMSMSHDGNADAGLKYGDDASFKVGESYSAEEIDNLKSTYGLKVVDEARDVKYSATYTATVDNSPVNGEEIVVITTIKVGDAWFYLNAKDVKNRYKRENSSVWTDLMASPVSDDTFVEDTGEAATDSSETGTTETSDDAEATTVDDAEGSSDVTVE